MRRVIKMKVAWFCIPAYGHTNPTLGLVKEIVSAGHEVYYFSFEKFRDKIEDAGAHYISCDGKENDFDMEDKQNADRVGKDIAFATELLVSSTLALDDMVADRIGEIKPDVIVADSVAYWGKLTAMKYGIPFVSSTTTFAFNKYSAKLMKQGAVDIAKMMFKMPKVNAQIKRLQAEGYPVKGILEIIQNDNETNTIVYTSDYYQPCADTFSDRYHFIGPSIRPIETPIEKTAEKTVYISLGTVNKNEEFYKNCEAAFADTPYQVIMAKGEEHFIDQMAALSIADVFITHCGMNSASEGLYFETPLLLFPQTNEQNAVAERTMQLGAGIRLDDISPQNILASTEELLNNSTYKECAVKISESFKRSGGVQEAREFIESVAENRNS